MPYTDIGCPFIYFGINRPVSCLGTRGLVLVDVCASKRKMLIYSAQFMSVCTSRFENPIANVSR